MTDINLGIFTANLDPAKCIYATSETLRISHHHFHGVLLGDFIDGLVAAGLKAPPRPLPAAARTADEPFELRPDEPITIRRLIARLNQALDETMVVIADLGDALFASSELVIHRQTEFISPAYYTSMGFAVPAALGVDGRPARPAAGRAGGRRRVPDDRHGTVDDRPPRLQPDRHRAGQPGLRHRAAAAPGRPQVQRHPALALSQAARGPRRRHAATRSAPKASSTGRCGPRLADTGR